MNRLLTAVIAAGGSLALGAGVLVMTAMPAAAAPPPTGGNSSYGASAPAGPVTAVPQALAQQTGPTLKFVSNVDISGLLSTGLTLDTASALAAFSRVTSVNAGFSFAGQTVSLVAKQVSSTCRSDTHTASANLIRGVLTVNGTVINLPNHPTADETFTFGGVTVTLNNQFAAAGGGVEDQAVHLQVGGRRDSRDDAAAQDLYIGVSVCNNPGSGSNTITVTSPGSQTTNFGTTITPLPITASDSDSSQVLTYAATGLPPGLSIDPSTGVISGTNTAATGSPFTVHVTATDTTGASGFVNFTWTIHTVVSVTNPGAQSGTVGTPFSLTMSATDSDPGITTFTWTKTGLPTGLNLNSSTGVISGTPSTVVGSPFTVNVTATDNTGASRTVTFTFTITA
jgi:hypothetical protein